MTQRLAGFFPARHKASERLSIQQLFFFEPQNYTIWPHGRHTVTYRSRCYGYGGAWDGLSRARRRAARPARLPGSGSSVLGREKLNDTRDDYIWSRITGERNDQLILVH